MYLSRTFWVFGFKLLHIMPMPYLKTNNLYQIISASNIIISSKRWYKNNYENIVYKNYNNSSHIDVNIIWVLKFGT